MTASSAEDRPRLPVQGARRRESVEEQADRRGIRPVRSVEDMACEEAFETDEELDDFLAFVYSERHANLT